VSKLQKALGKLRSEGATPTASGDRDEKQEQLLYRNLNRQLGSTGERPTGEVDVTRCEPPSQSIEVSNASLKEFGLLRNGAVSTDLAQQFQRIKRPILSIAYGDGGMGVDNANVILFASALPGSGKSFCCFNLAMSISRERDLGVVLVDADVLKPSISRAFGLSERPGLIDYLLDSNISLDDIVVGTDLQGIVVIPSGQQHVEATELLASKRMREFVETVANRFHSHAVLMDAPPLLVTNEAQALAERAGQIVFVVDAGVSTQDSVLRAVETLDRDKPINAILNKARGSSVGNYGFGYRDGYSIPASD
jgi:protein-tyrosine kinase